MTAPAEIRDCLAVSPPAASTSPQRATPSLPAGGEGLSSEQVVARCFLIAAEGRYQTARKRHAASRDLWKHYRDAKALCAAVGA